MTSQCFFWNPADLDLNYLTEILPCGELESIPYMIELQHHSILRELFARVVKLHSDQSVLNTAIINSLMYAAILELYKVSRSSSPLDYRIEKIINRMEKNPMNDPDYDDWMSECKLQKTQFYELFKKATGLPPKSYMQKIKMGQAAAALLESNESITKIAESLGYSSSNYFSKQFSGYYGLSPSSFRNRR